MDHFKGFGTFVEVVKAENDKRSISFGKVLEVLYNLSYYY